MSETNTDNGGTPDVQQSNNAPTDEKKARRKHTPRPVLLVSIEHEYPTAEAFVEAFNKLSAVDKKRLWGIRGGEKVRPSTKVVLSGG